MKETVLCSKLSLSYLFLQVITNKKKYRKYYIDLYAKSHGFFISFLIKIFGREKLAKLISNGCYYFGIHLMNIPHGDAVEDYHLLNIKAHEESCRLVSEWVMNYKATAFIFPKPIIDDDCQLSLACKSVGDHLWHLVENIAVLQHLNERQICLRIKHHYLPKEIITKLITQANIKVQYEADPTRFLVLPFLVSYLFFSTLRSILRGLFYKRAKADNAKPRIAIELVEQTSLASQPTHANFMLDKQADPAKFVFYVRKERSFFFDRPCRNNQAVEIVFINKLAPKWCDIKSFISIYLNLMHKFIFSGMAAQTLLQRIQYAKLFLDMMTFMRSYPLAAHVYNTFANAKQITVRLDSGLVTGICRYFGVKSVTYQTRVMYLDSYYFYYDAFDIYCVWGEAWQELIAKNSFVNKYHLIGNVYSPYSFEKNPAPAQLDSIVLFNADVESYLPQHHTIPYNINFLTIVLNAVKALPKPPATIFLKAKSKAEAELLLSQPEIIALQANLQINLITMQDGIHDIWAAIKKADAIISIGFTTPGICALGIGKKSIYVTPYQYEYNAIFTKTNPFIARDAKTLENMLLMDSPYNSELIKKVEPFCDGQSARRLYDLCMQLSDETCHAYS